MVDVSAIQLSNNLYFCAILTMFCAFFFRYKKQLHAKEIMFVYIFLSGLMKMSMFVSIEGSLYLVVCRQLIQIVGIYAMLKIIYKVKLHEVLFVSASILMMAAFGELIMFPVNLVLKNFIQSENFFIDGSFIVFDIALALVLVVVEKITRTELFKNLHRKEKIILSLVIFSYSYLIIIQLSFFLADVKVENGIIFVILISFIASNVILYFAGKTILKQESELIKKQQLDNLKNSVIKEQEMVQNKLVESNELIQLITSEMTKLNDGISQFENIRDKYKDYTKDRYTDNEVLNASLRLFVESFERKKIQYQFFIKTSCKIGLSDYDMVGLFSNILKNAEEAVEINPVHLRNVVLSVNKVNNIIKIECRNDMSVTSKKKDKKVSGIGLSIIEGIVKKQSGEVKKEAVDNQFIITILLFEQDN